MRWAAGGSWGQVLPSAKRRDACTKDGSRLSFSAISSGKYFSSSIARTSDSPRAKRKVPLARTQGRWAARSASAAARGSPRVLTGPCTEHLRLLPSGCAAQRPHLPVPSVLPCSRRVLVHTNGLNWRGGNRTRPTSPNHSLVVVPREAGPPRRPWALIGPHCTSDRLTGRRQLRRGGERRRCKRFLLAAQAFPGY